MTWEKVFTDEEFKAMQTRTLDLFRDAIDGGDKERSKELAQRMYEESNYSHDGYMV